MQPEVGTATHKPGPSILATIPDVSLKLKTFSLSPDRDLWLCCANSDREGKGLILVLDGYGTYRRRFDVEFEPTAIGFTHSAEGRSFAFIAGNGTIGKFSLEGRLLRKIESPHIGDPAAALSALKETLRRESSEIVLNIEKQNERIANKIAELETPPLGETPEELTRRERRLKLLYQQQKQVRLSIETALSADSGVDSKVFERVKYTPSLAVSKQYVFVAFASMGFSYEVWRLDHDLNGAQRILSNGRGCCEQYDIQSDGEHLVVAENCNFQVVFYAPDGTLVRKFGRHSRVDLDGFGSCCNPMNTRCEGSDVLTAESSIGHLKRFGVDGKLKQFIGTVPLGGGCKHAAIAHDVATDRYYMFNEGRKCLSVLVPKSETVEESEEDRASRVAMTGLGKRLIGSWTAEAISDDSPLLAKFLARKYGKLTFLEEGRMESPSTRFQLEATGPEMAALTKIARSEDAAKLLCQASDQLRWSAIEQRDELLSIRFQEDNTTTFNGDVFFIEPGRIKLVFSYGTTDTIAILYYRIQP